MVPGSFGLGTADFAAMAMFAPSARRATRDRQPDAARSTGDEERLACERGHREVTARSGTVILLPIIARCPPPGSTPPSPGSPRTRARPALLIFADRVLRCAGLRRHRGARRCRCCSRWARWSAWGTSTGLRGRMRGGRRVRGRCAELLDRPSLGPEDARALAVPALSAIAGSRRERFPPPRQQEHPDRALRRRGAARSCRRSRACCACRCVATCR